VLSGSDMVVPGVGKAAVLCHLRERRSILPSLSDALWNSLMESLIVAHSGDSGPPRAKPMMMASELSPMRERIRPPKRSVVNSKLPKINGFTEGGAITRQAFNISSNGEH
jgi:hypothetical protein